MVCYDAYHTFERAPVASLSAHHLEVFVGRPRQRLAGIITNPIIKWQVAVIAAAAAARVQAGPRRERRAVCAGRDGALRPQRGTAIPPAIRGGPVPLPVCHPRRAGASRACLAAQGIPQRRPMS